MSIVAMVAAFVVGVVVESQVDVVGKVKTLIAKYKK